MNELFIRFRHDPDAVIKELHEEYYIFRKIAIEAGVDDPAQFQTLFNDTLIILWKQRFMLVEDTNIHAFVHIVLRNKCISWARAQKSGKQLNIKALEVEDGMVQIEVRVDLHLPLATKNAMEMAWRKLPGQCKWVMDLRFKKRLAIKEIVAITGIKQPNVNGQISIGLGKLKKAMQRVDPDMDYDTIRLYLSALDSPEDETL